MVHKKESKSESNEEFNDIMEELLNLLEPQILFSVLKQHWNKMDQHILCDRLDNGMEFYVRFCDWISHNKAVKSKTAKKAKSMIKEIKDQQKILHHVAHEK